MVTGPYDVIIGAGEREQEREHYIRRVLEAFPERSEDPELLYGNPKLEFLRLANEGLIGLGGPRGQQGEKGETGYSQVLASDFGNITENTASLLESMTYAVANGLTLVLNGNSRYILDRSLVFPDNLKMQTNGALFVKTTNSNTYALVVGNNTDIDSLNLEVTGGAKQEAGIRVLGSNVNIGSVTVNCLTEDQTGPNGLLIGNLTLGPATKIAGIKIDKIELKSFRSPMRVVNVGDSKFSNINIQNFSTGIYVVDTVDTVFDRGIIRGTSKAAVGTAGQNGILMEAQYGDYSCKNVTFRNIEVDGAPEHSFRMGGAFTISDITYDTCISRNPGNALNNASTGGGAFKCLGGNQHPHRNIRYVNCSAEDSNTDGSGINNFTQFAFGFVDGLTLINPTVRAVKKTYSAQIAMFINAVDNVEVISPDFRDTKTFAVFIGKDGTNETGSGVSNFKIVGGTIHSARTHAVQMSPVDVVMDNIRFEKVTIIGNSITQRGLRAETASTYKDVFLGITYKLMMPLPVSGEPPLLTQPSHVLEYYGPIYGYTLSAANGSTRVNTTTQAFEVRRAGAWVAV